MITLEEMIAFSYCNLQSYCKDDCIYADTKMCDMIEHMDLTDFFKNAYEILKMKQNSNEKEVTKWIIDNVFRNDKYYMLHDEETLQDMIWDLLEIIASLHNEYYKAVNGEYYDYMFHWVNKMNCGSIKDDIFK